MKRLILAIVLICIPITANAWWKSIQQVAAGSPPPSYVGPGDVVSGALIWGSCARAYSSATLAGTSMCDLVDSGAPTTVICTLKTLANGFVDLASASCTGGLTPTVKCAAATGGTCSISKVYDQAAGTSGWVSTTAASQPRLTFSAINGLPGITFTSAANRFLQSTTQFTQSSPYAFVAVGIRTSNFTTKQSLMGWGTSPNGSLSFSSSANTISLDSNGASPMTLGSVTDNSFHALQGIIDSGSSGVIAVDGVETTGITGTTGPSSNFSRIGRFAGGASMDGTLMEAGLWPGATSGPNRTALNANMHGSNGYNF